MKDFFRPEFINRLDEVLTYNAPQPDRLRAIVDVQLARLLQRAAPEIADEIEARLQGRIAD